MSFFAAHMGHLVTVAAERPGSGFSEPLVCLTSPHSFIAGATCPFWP